MRYIPSGGRRKTRKKLPQRVVCAAAHHNKKWRRKWEAKKRYSDEVLYIFRIMCYVIKETEVMKMKLWLLFSSRKFSQKKLCEINAYEISFVNIIYY